jgi:Ca2+-binding EF-hand superfamily protein
MYGQPAYGQAPYGQAPYGQPQVVVMQQPSAFAYAYQPGFQPQNPAAYHLFMGVDLNRSGTVDARELHHALSNGGWTAFSYKTTKILMRMFDADGSGHLGYREFESLIGQLTSWRSWFDHADHDRSGKLSPPELTRCLQSFGFNYPPATYFSIFNAVDLDSSGTIGFDEFVQVLAEVNALTSSFRRRDPQSTGSATIDYASFIHMVYATRS